MTRNAFALATLLAIAMHAPARADDTLTLDHLTLTFDEEFQDFQISAWGPGTRWIAHTPWHGDFGDAQFDDPGPNSPFTANTQGLSITARKDSSGHWHSGLICSIDSISPSQKGFAQKYGYFEMKAKLPSGPGVWPAFWLIGTDRSKGTAEFDIMEFYGQFPGVFHATVHFWAKSHDSFGYGHAINVVPGILSSQFNTYGALIMPKTTTVYFNRHKVWETPTPPQFNTPMYILANLALGGGWPIDRLTSPQVMQIKYIRAYQEK